MLRYRTDETDDGLSGKEGSFLICSFWLVSALAIVGEVQRARDLMERLLSVASPLGLYAEEFDTVHRAPPRQLPAGLLAPGADRGGGADHPRRAPRGDQRMSHYDVIVIGSGAGGGTLVHRLAPSGKRILLLERGDWLPREPQNWDAADVFVDNRYISPDTWYDAERQGLPAAGALLRRRRDQALRRGALPPARRGLRRAAPPRRHLAGLADRLRRARAVLHAGRAALPGARRPRRGPDRAAGERAVSVPGGLARAADPAARRRPRRRRAAPLPRSLRRDARRGEHAVQHLRALRDLRRLPVPRARQVRRRGARRAARRSSTRTSRC